MTLIILVKIFAKIIFKLERSGILMTISQTFDRNKRMWLVLLVSLAAWMFLMVNLNVNSPIAETSGQTSVERLTPINSAKNWVAGTVRKSRVEDAFQGSKFKYNKNESQDTNMIKATESNYRAGTTTKWMQNKLVFVAGKAITFLSIMGLWISKIMFIVGAIMLAINIFNPRGGVTGIKVMGRSLLVVALLVMLPAIFNTVITLFGS